jgi:glutamate N-acetyltransferase / amino-acid N-acetyltransferase
MITSSPANFSATVELLVPRGFVFAAGLAGIKASGKPDLAYAEAPDGATAAAMFTTNRVVAAPVEIGRAHLRSAQGRVRAVLVNSGNANCATGSCGLSACEEICARAANILDVSAREIFPSSTGVIGVPLPAEKILTALPQLIASKCASPEAALGFARAIMTTDTRPKFASTAFRAGSATVNIFGVAKGSGMIQPRMATMLVYLFTDAAASPAELRHALKPAVDDSLNCISVDGDTSTNDTVLLMASGATGYRLSGTAAKKFQNHLHEICDSLAQQIVSDGEGVKHIVCLRIEQARSRDEAVRVARAIANSPLVKTAWAGSDPNWGRILSAVGSSGVPVNPGAINIFFGDQCVCRNGVANPFDARAAHAYLSQPSFDIRVQLGRGAASAKFLTCDLTAEYVSINADYTT